MIGTDDRATSLPFYPVFLSLKSRTCLVVGGGEVGERKVRGLSASGARIRIVAASLTEWLQLQVAQGFVDHVSRSFKEEQLDGIDLVFAATSDRQLNRNIAMEAHKRRLWCNMATDPEEGSFVLPAVFQRGPLTVAVGTSGASPAIARQIKQKLEAEFDNAWILLLELMGALRGIIQSKGLDSSANQLLFRQLAGLPLLDWIRSGDREVLVRSVCSVCHPHVSEEEMNRTWDKVWKAFS